MELGIAEIVEPKGRAIFPKTPIPKIYKQSLYQILMVTFPFKNHNKQRPVGFLLGMVGLLLVAIGINNSQAIPIEAINTIWIGAIILLIGLYYFIEVTLN